MSQKKIQIKLAHSPIGCPKKQKNTVLGLGLTRLHQVREVLDTPATRGMVLKVPHLVEIVGGHS